MLFFLSSSTKSDSETWISAKREGCVFDSASSGHALYTILLCRTFLQKCTRGSRVHSRALDTHSRCDVACRTFHSINSAESTPSTDAPWMRRCTVGAERNASLSAQAGLEARADGGSLEPKIRRYVILFCRFPGMPRLGIKAASAYTIGALVVLCFRLAPDDGLDVFTGQLLCKEFAISLFARAPPARAVTEPVAAAPPGLVGQV